MPQSPPDVPVPRSATYGRERFAKAYSILESAIKERAFPGASFSVLANKEIVALDGVGALTYERDSPPVTAGTVFDLASVTKVLATTSMAMLLHQRGKLALDQRLAEWLPAFAQNEPLDSPRYIVTLRMLLAHASGLPGYVRLFETCRDSESLVEACLRQPLEAAPGIRAEYSDLGFILLGRVLEMVAGEAIDKFCAREIFHPLGMDSTCYRPPADWKRFIAPTQDDRAFRHRVIQGEVQDENCYVMGGVSGHTGLFANVLDPLRYAWSVLNQRDTPEPLLPAAKIFAPSTVEFFTQRAELPPGSSRALGWDTPSPPSSSGNYFSHHTAGHLGYAGTSLWIDFERQIAVVLLTNRTWPNRETQAIRQVRPAFHDAVMTSIGNGA